MVLDNKQSVQNAILETVIYSDIFHFPLTAEEIWKFLIGKRKISRETFNAVLKSCYQTGRLTYKDDYFCLKGRKQIITKRQKHKDEVKRKLSIARKAAFYLSYIPSILFIGISGSLAMENIDATSDIDFFIITKKDTLWTTRLWVLGILEAMNLRRKRTDTVAANKICANLFIEETRFSWTKDKHNIYAAHEIVQLVPLFERKNTYKNFLTANTWVQAYFPNFDLQSVFESSQILRHREYSRFNAIFLISNLFFIKKVVQFLQQKYIQKHQTKELIEKDFVAFHPHDYADHTIYFFNESLKAHGIDKHLKINYTHI